MKSRNGFTGQYESVYLFDLNLLILDVSLDGRNEGCVLFHKNLLSYGGTKCL